MDKENNLSDCCKKKIFKNHHCHNRTADQGAIYGLGVVGALFYFLQNTTTFETVMIGIGKAIFWPAILMFKLLTYLGI